MGARDVAQLVEYSPSLHEALGSIPSMALTSSEISAPERWKQISLSYVEFEDSLGYMRPCLNDNNKALGTWNSQLEWTLGTVGAGESRHVVIDFIGHCHALDPSLGELPLS